MLKMSPISVCRSNASKMPIAAMSANMPDVTIHHLLRRWSLSDFGLRTKIAGAPREVLDQRASRPALRYVDTLFFIAFWSVELPMGGGNQRRFAMSNTLYNILLAFVPPIVLFSAMVTKTEPHRVVKAVNFLNKQEADLAEKKALRATKKARGFSLYVRLLIAKDCK